MIVHRGVSYCTGDIFVGVVHYNTEMISMEIVTYGSWAVRCFASAKLFDAYALWKCDCVTINKL